MLYQFSGNFAWFRFVNSKNICKPFFQCCDGQRKEKNRISPMAALCERFGSWVKYLKWMGISWIRLPYQEKNINYLWIIRQTWYCAGSAKKVVFPLLPENGKERCSDSYQVSFMGGTISGCCQDLSVRTGRACSKKSKTIWMAWKVRILQKLYKTEKYCGLFMKNMIKYQ